MPFALIAFIIIPIIEIVILIEVGGIIGALPTAALVVLTAVIGVTLLKREGIMTLARVQRRLDQGELPETELLEGVMLLVGGALLLTPGFVTDTFGFICIVPGLRRPLARWIIRRGTVRAMTVMTQRGGFAYREQHQGRTRDGHETIDGEFEEHDNDDRNPQP